MKRLLLKCTLCLFSLSAYGVERVVNLVIDYKKVNFTGLPVCALAINNQIPAPALHFKEGDEVTLNVYNNLKEGTALHWHGIILPWQMDGVAGITQHAIKPGSHFRYKFKLEQSGTYWYHAHAGLQEQQGLYGAFVIEPLEKPSYHYTKDFTIVLSDWSNTNPEKILANLKKEGDYYSPNFPLQPSLMRYTHDLQKADKEERLKLIEDYRMMQQMGMSIYDINDVAYDAFLLNGHTNENPWVGLVNKGDIVRLRFIGAAGNTVFQIKLPSNEMEIVHVQGNDVVPYKVASFNIAPGETYDVLVKINNNAPQPIYVESTDKVGFVYGALKTSADQNVNYQDITPFSEPKPVTREMMSYGMMHHGMGHGMDHGMDHGMPQDHHSMMEHHSDNTHQAMKHEVEHPHAKMSASDNAESSQIAKTKYKQLKALVKTNDPNIPIYKTITMDLDGWMDRFIWFINGVPEHLAHPFIFEPNKRYRIIFKNQSMMHHPMHLHGHWFIVRNNHDEYDPLLHTIDMPPGATIVVDVDSDASGQWLLHCHFLYHMMSGMARVIQYSTLLDIVNDDKAPEHIVEKTNYHNRPIIRVDTLPIDAALVKHPMAHEQKINFSNLLTIANDPFHNVQRLSFKGLYGYDYDKLDIFINDAEMKKGTVENLDVDTFYWHLLSQFWALKGGVNYNYRPAKTPYWQPGIGIEGMTSYFIHSDVRAYHHKGSFKLDIECERETQITNNFFIGAGLRGILASKTVEEDEIGAGFNQLRLMLFPYYRVKPGFNLLLEYEFEKSYETLKRIKQEQGESIQENTFSLGAQFLF